MSYPCHYTNLCPHKPHKHAHTHTRVPQSFSSTSILLLPYVLQSLRFFSLSHEHTIAADSFDLLLPLPLYYFIIIYS